MNYYQHNINDYLGRAGHLSDSLQMTYLRLIWLYYQNEKPLEKDISSLALQTGKDPQNIAIILKSFFDEKNDGFHHKKCDEEIEKYKSNTESRSKRAIQQHKAKRANAVQMQCNTSANHKPITINHKKENETKEKVAVAIEKKQTLLAAAPLLEEARRTIGGISQPFQEKALRLAQYLGIDLSDARLKGRWMAFFKANWQDGGVDAATSYLKDYGPFLSIEGAEGRAKYFFDCVYKSLWRKASAVIVALLLVSITTTQTYAATHILEFKLNRAQTSVTVSRQASATATAREALPLIKRSTPDSARHILLKSHFAPPVAVVLPHQEEMAAKIRAIFVEDPETAVAVFRCESGLRENAVGDHALTFTQNGAEFGKSYGVAQIRHLPGRPSPDYLLSAENNLQYAHKLWQRSGWAPWSAWTKGCHHNFLSQK